MCVAGVGGVRVPRHAPCVGHSVAELDRLDRAALVEAGERLVQRVRVGSRLDTAGAPVELVTRKYFGAKWAGMVVFCRMRYW